MCSSDLGVVISEDFDLSLEEDPPPRMENREGRMDCSGVVGVLEMGCSGGRPNNCRLGKEASAALSNGSGDIIIDNKHNRIETLLLLLIISIILLFSGRRR